MPINVQETINSYVHKGASSRAGCSICCKKIPEDVVRMEYRYHDGAFQKTFRICGLCLKRMSKKVNNKALNDWALKITAEEI